MKQNLGQEPAFPVSITEIVDSNIEIIKDENGNDKPINVNKYGTGEYRGMSKRFYAACKAMSAILTSESYSSYKYYEEEAEQIVKSAYILADELLKQENELL